MLRSNVYAYVYFTLTRGIFVNHPKLIIEGKEGIDVIKMLCENCGKAVSEDWKFCPDCGSRLRKRREIIERRLPGFMGFESLFKDIDRELKRMDKLFKFEWDEKDLFKRPFRGGGVSIRISSEKGKEPKIEVRTFGDYKKHEPELKRRFEIVEEIPEKARKGKERAPPKVTEEPETKVERVEGKLILRLKVPEVKSEEDIDIQRLEESIEVRAYAKDKAYFTLFSIPPRARIISRKLEGEELIIEIEE